MDVLSLSRLQFAVTAAFHFVFVPLTLGLSVLVAYWESRYLKTNDDLYLRMARFWGKLFLINFVLGVVTGLTMEFQFGMNWAEYSKYVGDIFGAPLAIEATVAFFLESVFLGVWAFGWKKVSPKVHVLSIWLVAIAANLSALWILLANGWMQEPVGFILRNGRAEMVNFWALIANRAGWIEFFHTVLSGFVVAAFFVMGISAYHLLRKNNPVFFKTSFRTAAVFGLVSSLLVAVSGDFHAVGLAKTQPAKMAAMESHWESKTEAPFHLLLWPNPRQEKNSIEMLRIPKGLSLLAFHEGGAMVKGLKEFPVDERPPVLPTFLSFRLMVLLGLLFILVSFAAWLRSRKGKIEGSRFLLKLTLVILPLPYIAAQLGWIVTEVGRQPWLVYGVLKTSEGVSKSVSHATVVVSLVGFSLIYGLLAAADIYLLAKNARKGPPDRGGAK